MAAADSSWCVHAAWIPSQAARRSAESGDASNAAACATPIVLSPTWHQYCPPSKLPFKVPLLLLMLLLLLLLLCLLRVLAQFLVADLAS